MQWGREIGLNSKCNKDNWGFIAKEQGEGINGGDIRGREILAKGRPRTYSSKMGYKERT